VKSRFMRNKEESTGPRVKVGLYPRRAKSPRLAGGFTLLEVVISVAIIALVFAGIVRGNIQSAQRAEWSGYSLAASALANQQIEQCRSALWDNGIYPPVNQLSTMTNLNNWTYNTNTQAGSGYSWADLDIPISGTNRVRATNYVSVRMFNLNNSSNPPVKVQMVQVDTVWPFNRFSGKQYFTNRTATYLAPDDRSPGTF
jgi:prepilin-type N-terminal cleavage/methylation domain-containing protein